MVPFDERSPFVTSGIRLGTAAITTRGCKEAEMVKIAAFINRAIDAKEDDAALAKIKEEVKQLMSDFPLYK